MDVDPMAAAVPLHRAAGEGDAIWAMGSLFELKLTPTQSAGLIGIAEVTQPPGIAPPLHVHRNEAEVFYVVDGAMRYEAGGSLHELTAGSMMFLPQGVPHRFLTVRRCRLLVITCPGGLLDLYTSVGIPATERAVPTVPDPDEISRWNQYAPEYGLEVLGPPLGAHQ